jgi:chorismate synthase
MTGNSFGHTFRFTTFGESHGPAIGVVVDGVPPRLPLTEGHIQPYLDARRPGQSRHTTQRREADQVEILSGVHEGRTTGTPIALLIRNTDQRPKDYADITAKFRPGHADWAYMAKYGIRDPRGGGRSSARETACRVAAGAVARLIVPGVTIRACVTQVGPHACDIKDWAFAATNPLFCPDPDALPRWEAFLDETRKRGSSAGAVVCVEATGVPPGLGAPVYDKLDADLAKALMSINAVKAVEVGAGFAAAALAGEDNADEMLPGPAFASNNAGGILGGISTGQDIVARAAFKPTSSIRIPRRTIDTGGAAAEVVTTGRHDPCVGIRGAPVVEAMVACVLADHALRHRAQCSGG